MWLVILGDVRRDLGCSSAGHMVLVLDGQEFIVVVPLFRLALVRLKLGKQK